jgi:alkanesulfonate monooxygenase SsuD/methylene tetrahydromethanopterin reductase-like flavin-dependent oxidoreductase (luciferase family)
LYDLSDVPWRHRFERLDETVALWRHLWATPGPSSFDGQLVQYESLPPTTQPRQPGGPPIWLAGATPAATERTGRSYDGWLPYPVDASDYSTGWAAVRRSAEASARSADAITAGLYVTILIADAVEVGRRALDAYTHVSYGMPLEVVEAIQLMVTGPRELVRDRLQQYISAGARHIVCRIGALNLGAQADQLEQLARVLT